MSPQKRGEKLHYSIYLTTVTTMPSFSIILSMSNNTASNINACSLIRHCQVLQYQAHYFFGASMSGPAFSGDPNLVGLTKMQ